MSGEQIRLQISTAQMLSIGGDGWNCTSIIGLTHWAQINTALAQKWPYKFIWCFIQKSVAWW